MGRLFNNDQSEAQPTQASGRLGASGFFSSQEEEEKRRREEEQAQKNVPETFQEEKPQGFIQKVKNFFGGKTTNEEKDKQVEQAKSMAQEMLPEAQKEKQRENEQVVAKKQQANDDYYENLKQQVQKGTAVKTDKLILNVEAARMNNQKEYDLLMQELRSISPTDDPSNDVKIFGLDIYNPDKPKVAAFEVGMLRAANLGNYDSGIKDDPTYKRALEIEKNLTRLEEENRKFESFINKGKTDEKYLQDVVVSAEIPTAEQIDRAEEMARENYLRRATKDLEEVEKPDGFWAVFKEQINATTQVMTQKAISGLSEALSDGMVGDGEQVVPFANRLSEYADSVNFKLQEDMASNPQWFYTGDSPDEKVAAFAGKMLPSLGGVIAAVGLGVVSKGKINPTPLLQASFYGFALSDYGQAYRDAIDTGATVDQAQQAATFAAGTSFVLNKWADTALVKGSGFGLSDVAENTAQATFKNKVRDFSLAASKTFASQALVQGTAGGAQQFGFNLASRIYDEHADLFEGVSAAALEAGIAGGAFGLVSDPLSRKQTFRAKVSPEAEEVGTLLREKGMVADYDNMQVSTLIEPVTVYRGGVEDDSTRPTMQLGKSYTMNPLEPDQFAIEASERSGQKPIVQTVELAPGSKVVKLPDTYDARLINPEDPRLEGIDAVILTDRFIKGGESEIVVLNQKAVVVKETRPAVDVLNKKTEAVPEEADLTAQLDKSLQPEGKVILAGGVKDTPEGSIKRATEQRDSYLKDVEEIAGEIGARYPKELEGFAVKSVESLAEKISRPDASGGTKGDKEQTDLLRFTLEIKDPKSVDDVLSSLKKRGYEVYNNDVTNRFDDPTPGYKDISIKVVKGGSDPIIKELQLLQPNMLKAKMEKGHDIYDVQKRIALYKKANPNDAGLARLEQKLTNLSNKLYESAFLADNPSSSLPASTNDSKSSSESAVPELSASDISAVKDFLKSFEEPSEASRISSSENSLPDSSLSDRSIGGVNDDTGIMTQRQRFVNEEKPKTSRQIAQEPVGGTEDGAVSSAYNRVKDRLADEFQDDLKYNQMNLEEDARQAVDFVASDPKKARRVALGLENAPKGMTETSISIAAANAAAEAGDHALQARLEAARSLRQTRRGQEIVAERGRFDENSPHTFIARVMADRLAAFGKKAGAETMKEVTGKKSTAKTNATRIIDTQAAEAKKVLTKSEFKIAEAQSLIDSLTC